MKTSHSTQRSRTNTTTSTRQSEPTAKSTKADKSTKAERPSNEPRKDTSATTRRNQLDQSDFTPGKTGASRPMSHTLAATSTGSTSHTAPPKPIGFVDKPGQVPESQVDGAVVGAGGAVYPAGTDPYSVKPVGPNNGKQPTETVYYVNGIQNDAHVQYGSMQNVANELGANVYGIHNSTDEKHPLHSIVGDLTQCLTDLAKLPNSATAALAKQLVQDLEAGRPVHLMAHSQGALVTSNALSAAKEYLLTKRQPPLSADKVDQMLSRIKVETFGGAAPNYPYGPQYTHYINTFDTVPMNVGLGSHTSAYARQQAAGGDRATFHFIHDDPRSGNPLMQNNLTQLGEVIPAHNFNEGYLHHRMPWAEGHANNADLTGQSPVIDVPGHPGEAATYTPNAPSAPEAARRQAGQAESDAALARVRAEAALREARKAAASGDPARAAQAAARAEQAANEAAAAYQRAQAAADEALRATLADPAAGIGYVPGGAPPAAPAALYHAENAKTNMDEALRQAQEAREIAQRALRDSQNPAAAA